MRAFVWFQVGFSDFTSEGMFENNVICMFETET